MTGEFAMVLTVVKFRPRSLRTSRYAFRSLLHPTITSGRPNGKCIVSVVDKQTEAQPVWFFKSGSVKIQANFFWNWYCLFEN